MIAHEGFGGRRLQRAHGEPHREAVCGRASFRLVVTAAGRSTSLRRTRAPGGTRRTAGGCSLVEACDSSAWAQPPSRSAQGNASVLDQMAIEELALAEVETSVVVRSFLNLKRVAK